MNCADGPYRQRVSLNPRNAVARVLSQTASTIITVHSLIHLFAQTAARIEQTHHSMSKYLQRTSYMPGTGLRAEEAPVSRPGKVPVLPEPAGAGGAAGAGGLSPSLHCHGPHTRPAFTS